MDAVELTKAFLASWPLVILVIALIFLKDIKSLIAKIAKLKFVIAGKEVTLDFNVTNEIVKAMLYSMEKMLKGDRLQKFSEILEFTNENKKKPRIKDIFGQELIRPNNEDKEGNTKEGVDAIEKGDSVEILTTLRAIRGLNLIQPAEGAGASWGSNSEIEVTPFGKFVSEHEELKKLLESK